MLVHPVMVRHIEISTAEIEAKRLGEGLEETHFIAWGTSPRQE